MIEIKIADLQQLHEISVLNEWVKKEKARKESLYKAIQKGNCFVAMKDEQVVGYVVFSRSFFENWFIKLLYVDEAYRRSGIATLLMNEVSKQCVTPKLFVSTNDSNEAMKSLLNRLDFHQTGFLENINDDEREVFYVKHLKQHQ
ncbi:GNAT family N-acetyltransferase [Bacillus sp. FJAT-47783]|uniref:GNAT family N-acetyltransferase n=1 Tax=Bacillus sp. FJAT-47783 TaxID=2922712 RepID=UPI001FAC8A41|nr:GNAT family N-acetyltransferase [Bacillus sp. FJAT-47783]